jgi:hypothetical protein
VKGNRRRHVRLTPRPLWHRDAQLLCDALASRLPGSTFGITEKVPGQYHVVFVPTSLARSLRRPDRLKLFVRGFLAHPEVRSV